MAKQDFVNGGFTGKLGALVGGKWKKFYTIRVRTDPSNPRTPVQQANRELFRRGVAAAQVAQQANYGVECWFSDSCTAWALRCASAKVRLRDGVDWFAAIPFHPDSYTPAYRVETLGVATIVDGRSVSFPVSGALPAESRVFSVVARVVPLSENRDDCLVLPGVFYPDGTPRIVVETPFTFVFADNPEIRLVTRDDSEHDNEMCVSPPLFFAR